MTRFPPESRATVYTTLAGPEFRQEIEIKRSRFITVLRRTGDEDGARSVLAGLRKEFHDAAPLLRLRARTRP
jgi:putative IMPACT (imprinted ancient) family translation regulator